MNNFQSSLSISETEIEIKKEGPTKVVIVIDFLNEPEFASVIYSRLCTNLFDHQTLSLTLKPPAAPPDGSD